MAAYAESDQPEQRLTTPLVVAMVDVPIDLNPVVEAIKDTGHATDGRLSEIITNFGDLTESMGENSKKYLEGTKAVKTSVEDVSKNINTGLDNVGKQLSFGEKILDSLGNISGPILNFAGDMASTATTIWGISSILEPWFKVIDSSINTVTSNLTRESAAIGNAIKAINPIFNVQGESLIIQPSDSPLVRLFKNGMNAVISPINGLSNLFKVQSYGMTIQSSDSMLTKLFKTGIQAVIDPIKALKPIFDVQSYGMTIQPSDSMLTKLFKTGIQAVIDPIKALKPIFDVQSYDMTIQPSDSMLAKLFKTGIKSIVAPLDTLNNLFRVGGEMLVTQTSDSSLVKLFKFAMRAIISPIDTLNNVFKGSELLTVQSADSPLIKLFKNAINSIIDNIKKISVGDISTSFDLSPLLNGINTGFKNMGTDLQNLGSIITNGFAGLMSGLGGLFIPSGSGFVDNVSDLSDRVKKKIPFAYALPAFILSLFTPIKTDWFEAVSFEFMGVSSDFAQSAKPYADTYVPIFRGMVSLLLWLTLIMKCYRRVIIGGAVADGGDSD